MMELVKVSEELATSVLATSFFVIHDSGRGGENHEAELTRRHQIVDPLLNVGNLDVEARRDDTGLVQATVQLDDNLAGAVVIDDFKLTNVS